MDTKKVIKYIFIALIPAWIIGSAVSLFYLKHQNLTGLKVFQTGAMVMMYTPFVAAIICNKGFKGFGWKPKFKGCAFLIPFCLWGPQILSLIGLGIFLLIFPNLFDFSGSYLVMQGEQAGVDLFAQLEAKGVTYPVYALISLVQAFTNGVLINTFVALGEEVGWRGLLYPELNKKFGKIGTWIIGGTIWSAFHFPLIIIAGYEYGFDYAGFPFTGLLMFTLYCIVFGIMEEIVYDKSKCIWYPSILHGAMNTATFTLLFVNVNDPGFEKYRLLGPAANGIIAMIPFIIAAVIMGAISIKSAKKEKN